MPRNARVTRALGIGTALALLDGDRGEVGRRLVGPQPFAGDQLADQLIVRTVLQQLIAEPGDEAAAAVDQERAILGADECAGEAFGKVVGTAALAQDSIEPPLQALAILVGFELADFLQRRDRAGQRQR
jgi:hypothetical protein